MTATTVQMADLHTQPWPRMWQGTRTIGLFQTALERTSCLK